MSDVIRIGKMTYEGREVVVVALFGETVATSHLKVEEFDTDPDFVRKWTDYFTRRFVNMWAEQLHANRAVHGWGWSLATARGPVAPQFPTEGEEG